MDFFIFGFYVNWAWCKSLVSLCRKRMFWNLYSYAIQIQPCQYILKAGTSWCIKRSVQICTSTFLNCNCTFLQMDTVTPTCYNYLLSSPINLCPTCSHWLINQCRHKIFSNLKTQVQSRTLSDLPLKRDKKYNHVLRSKYEPQSTLTSVRFFFNILPR